MPNTESRIWSARFNRCTFVRWLPARTFRRIGCKKLVHKEATERADVVDRFEAALAAGKSDSAFHLIHGFKSVAGTLGARELQALCAEVESACREGKPSQELIERFGAHHRRLVNDINQVLADSDAN